MPWTWMRGLRRTISLPHVLRGSVVAIGLGIPLSLTSGLYHQHSQLLADAEQRAANTAHALEHHAARTIEVTDAYLQAVASLVGSRAQEGRTQALHASLREQLIRSRGLKNIVVTDQNGTSVAEAVTFPARPLDVHERDYFQALRDRPGEGLAIGKPFVGILGGQLVLPIARRIEDEDGKFAGIVQAVLDAEAFQTFYDQIDEGPGALLHLWRIDGTMLVRSPSKPELIGQSFAGSKNFQRYVVTRTTKPFWSVDATDGAERVIALGFLKGYPLYVRSSLSKMAVLAPWRRSVIIQTVFGAVVTLLLVAALLLLAREIERRRATDVYIRASERRFRLLAENSNDIIVLGDLALRRLYVSPAVRTVLGYEPEEFIGCVPYDFVHPDDASVVAQTWADTQSGVHEQVVSCMRYRHKGGHYVWIEVSVRVMRDEQNGQPAGYVAALRDINDRRNAEQQVRHMALHDALTDLPHRSLFHDRLDQALVRATLTRHPFAVLVCDLDRFKAVNDSFGHPVGDALLCAVAARMKALLRPHDTIARLGGDEFAIVLDCLEEPCSAAHIAERLITAVSTPVELDGLTIEVGISIGLTLVFDATASADELFKRADMALYEAKAAGRNTYREFYPGTTSRIAVRGQLGLDMKEAIRLGEFHLVYQPVVDAEKGEPVSFEALMRWRHPIHGEISPSEFIPVAEETGLIVPLGAWALQEACRQAMNWPASIRIAVNVSAVQLQRPGLEATVLSTLAASGLPADRLKLEVTESVLMQDADEVLGRLHRLRALGVRIALDDFGTGYSSLSYLRRFPFDKIKIDRSFIRDIADPDAAAIVRAVVSIGERLGMGIVAEGVETREQLDLVRREGCTQVQGFLFGRPLPAHEARLYVTKHLCENITSILAA